MSREDKPPKERYLRALVINTWRLKSCQPFFRELTKVKDIKSNPLVAYKVRTVCDTCRCARPYCLLWSIGVLWMRGSQSSVVLCKQ